MLLLLAEAVADLMFYLGNGLPQGPGLGAPFTLPGGVMFAPRYSRCFDFRALITRASSQPDSTGLFQLCHRFTTCTFTCIRPGSFFCSLFILPMPCLFLCFKNFFFKFTLNKTKQKCSSISPHPSSTPTSCNHQSVLCLYKLGFGFGFGLVWFFWFHI